MITDHFPINHGNKITTTFSFHTLRPAGCVRVNWLTVYKSLSILPSLNWNR